MTVFEVLTVAALWGAGAYRGVRARRRPATWRTALAVSVVALAIAATAHFNRIRLDEWLNISNVTNLGSRLALCVAVASAQIYLLGTRHSDIPDGQRRTIYAVSAATAATSSAAWLAAPIHTVELADLGEAPRHLASFVYIVTIYLYLAWFEVGVARYAHQSFRSARSTDPPAAVAIALIGASAWSGIAVLLMWTTHSSVAQIVGRSTPYLDRMATLLFPVPLTLFASGLLALPALPALAHRLAARRLTVRLDPLWRLIVNQHPHVHLPLRQDRITQVLDPRLKAQRRLIEISDGLEEHQVAMPTTLMELAGAMGKPLARMPGAVSAKDALTQLDRAPWPRPLISLSDALRSAERSPRRD